MGEPAKDTPKGRAAITNRNAARKLVELHGRFLHGENEPRIMVADVGDFRITHFTPFWPPPESATQIVGTSRYGIDVWKAGKGKVLSVVWDQEDEISDLRIQRFVRGGWETELLRLAYGDEGHGGGLD